MPTTIFPNFPPGGHIDDENNKKAIEALQNAKEYSIVTEDILQQESILSEYSTCFLKFATGQTPKMMSRNRVIFYSTTRSKVNFTSLV